MSTVHDISVADLQPFDGNRNRSTSRSMSHALRNDVARFQAFTL